MDETIVERALMIPVPEAETVVRTFRARYQSRAAGEIPAHVTINHPFTPVWEDESHQDGVLADLFSLIRPFQFALTEVQHFPEALYLALEAEGEFMRLINMVAAHFPESPPYGGRFDKIIPHLTVAYLPESEEINAMGIALHQMTAGVLPIVGTASKVVLMENNGFEWRERNSYPFAGK